MRGADRARAAFDSARVVLEAELRERPDDPRVHTSLGLTYAGLGRHDEAVRHEREQRSSTLCPKTSGSGRDTFWTSRPIYLMLGEHDSALEQLDRYLAADRSLHINNRLRLDPTWDPLRDHPRFQALLEKYE